MLPNFFVAGCQKCATTSLHHYLIQHPEIYLLEQKETKHFAVDEWYIRGISYYESEFFSGVKSEIAIGEVDPDYIYFEKVLERIKIHFDIEQLKFIFIFRNPVERAFSHYLMTYRRGIETKPFADAIACERERIETDFLSKMHFSYVDRGFYYRQLLPFLKVLQPEQMLFLLTDDLQHNRNAVLKKCFDFLGVDDRSADIEARTNYHQATIPRSKFLLNEIVRKQDTLPKKIIRVLIPNQKLRLKVRAKILAANQTSNIARISLQKRERFQLIDIYRDENQKLAALIKKDLSHWNQA